MAGLHLPNLAELLSAAVRAASASPPTSASTVARDVGCAASGVLARRDAERTGEAGGDEDVLGNQVVDGRAAEAIPVLEQKLRNGRMDSPPPGYPARATAGPSSR